MSPQRFVFSLSVFLTVGCADPMEGTALTAQQQSASLQALSIAHPGLDQGAFEVNLLDGGDGVVTGLSMEATAEGGEAAGPQGLAAGSHTLQVAAVVEAPEHRTDLHDGATVSVELTEGFTPDVFIMDGYVAVIQDGPQITGFGAVSVESADFDCGAESWKEVHGLMEESGNVVLTVIEHYVVAGKACAESEMGEQREEIAEYVLTGSMAG